ncbi:Soluble lytic murein transglycosylase [bioreactor metagenome]|uniref:Soluble lytic murein transglycosylase n=1 Tax=bioreactor metagenome TaxID=1076179 RepID=A0A645IX27_9ZZZZ
MAKRILLVVLITLGAVAAIVGAIYMRDTLLKQRYPLKYESTIVKYAGEYGLDPYFICAMIDTESNFRVDAVSEDGARGLMQIMPETSEWIAGKLDVSGYDIFDPDTNIRFGCWYLRFLKDRFSGEEQLMIAAYNAGHNKVEEWLAEGYSKDGSTLDEIPYAETKKYIDKVTRAYEEYQKLYQIG